MLKITFAGISISMCLNNLLSWDFISSGLHLTKFSGLISLHLTGTRMWPKG